MVQHTEIAIAPVTPSTPLEDEDVLSCGAFVALNQSGVEGKGLQPEIVNGVGVLQAKTRSMQGLGNPKNPKPLLFCPAAT